MARYSKIGVQIWGDSKFCTLSRANPNAQTLWFYLLTNPGRTALPGVFIAGETTLAEGLAWPLAAFRRCWREIEAQNMAEADWRARLVWIRKQSVWDPPTSPNAAKGWGRVLVQMPECELRDRIEAFLYAFTEGLGEPFAKAFAEGVGKPSRTPPSASGTAFRSPLPRPSPMPSPTPSPAAGTARAPGERGGIEPGPPPEPTGPTVRQRNAWARALAGQEEARVRELGGVHPFFGATTELEVLQECSRLQLSRDLMARVYRAYQETLTPEHQEAEPDAIRADSRRA
jgi:hypothetical protein